MVSYNLATTVMAGSVDWLHNSYLQHNDMFDLNAIIPAVGSGNQEVVIHGTWPLIKHGE